MMSGTDLSLYGVVRPFYRPRQYAHRLARSLGCSTVDSYTMLNCLRSPNITWEQFVHAQRQIIPNVSQFEFFYHHVHILSMLNFTWST